MTNAANPTTRAARRERTTKETSITIAIDVDGPAGVVQCSTGLPFFDHMLDQIGRHGGFDLEIDAKGDIEVDGHHTVEDVGILLGEAFREVLPLGEPPFNPEMVEHFWQSFATAAGITLHVTKKAGVNTHHVVEATFKGVSRCLREAVRVEGSAVPSTKGTL